MTGYGCWLFDLDGTIVDVEWHHVRAVFDEVGDRLGRAFTDREAAAIWHGFAGERNTVLHELELDADRFWTAFHAVEDPEERATATVVYDDARAIPELDAPIGLVTHCQSHLTAEVLDRLAIEDWFDVVVCCDDEIGWKPDPTPIDLALDDLGVDGTDAVYVGDGPHDIGAAWNAGVDAVHVERHGHRARGCCVVADHRCRSLAELDALHSGSGGVDARTVRSPPIPESCFSP